MQRRAIAVIACAMIAAISACGEPTDTGSDDLWDLGLPPRDADGADVLHEDSGGIRDASDDALDASFDGGDAAQRNTCGGVEPLLYDGVPATPGQVCGCGGMVVCRGAESVVCLGSAEQNACGGCATLTNVPDTPCGPCGEGAWSCDGPDDLACVGGTGANVCGGCLELQGSPGDICDSEEGIGLRVCTQRDDLFCLGVNRNRCGGLRDSLDREQPGDPCGTCDLGSMVCDGRDAVACVEGDATTNACGGCAALYGAPGEPCGVCGDVWECDPDDPNRVVCLQPDLNQCGGCERLTDVPGSTCTRDDGTAGRVACVGFDEVTCGPPDRNACGGTADLDVTIGESCGECDDGFIRCVSPEQAMCIGDRGANACGGCGALPGLPGASCGLDREYRCTADGSSRCTAVRRTGVIGPTGGRVQLGDVMLDARDDVAASTTAVTIELIDPPTVDGFVVTTPLVRIGPDDIEVFNPIEVRLVSSAPDESSVFAFDAASGAWLRASGSRVRPDGVTLVGEVTPPTTVFGGYRPLDCAESERNACGGCAELPGVPGDRCGACGLGVLGCWDPEDPDTLTCTQDRTNACGGCGVLDGAPGDPCGPCGIDDLVCAPDGESLICDGATTENACGGCARIEGAPGEACGPCDLDTLTCSDDGLSLFCDGATSLNVCGGCRPLDPEPGEPCGPCDLDAFECRGSEFTVCQVRVTMNACGACGPLAADPGDACGPCGDGVLACSDDGLSLTCEGGTTPNVCGVCAMLEGTPGTPCGPCGGGLTACSESGVALECVGADASNACGGCNVLAGDPGDACGPCGADSLVCSPDGEALVCDGASTDNACGGCGPLDGAPGTACGACGDGTWTCNGDGTAVACQGATAPNACGGCGTLDGTPGDSCGPCGLDELVCAPDGTALACDGDTFGNECGGCTPLDGAQGDGCEGCGADVCRLGCAGLGTLACYGSDEGWELIPAGLSTLGPSPVELGRTANDMAMIDVRITRPFWASPYEVTIGQWSALIGGTTPRFWDCGDDCPMVYLTWWEALAYANEASTAAGLEPCYELVSCVGVPGLRTIDDPAFLCDDVVVTSASGSVYDCEGYRLPTDAEWEHAARAGVRTATATGDLTAADCSDTTLPDTAWFCGNADSESVHCARVWREDGEYCVGLQPVGGLAPNAWGLYDMLGNASEYVWDTWDPAVVDTVPIDPVGDERLCLRGGSYDGIASSARLSARWILPDRSNGLPRYVAGIRLVRTAQ